MVLYRTPGQMASSVNSLKYSKNIELGQTVSYSSILERIKEHQPIPNTLLIRHTNYWKDKRVKGKGIIIGQRTLFNRCYYFSPEVGYTDNSKEYFKVYIVAYNINKKPVLVRPERLVKISMKEWKRNV